MMLPIESHWRVINKSNDFQEIYLPTDSTWYFNKPGYGPGLVLGRAVAGESAATEYHHTSMALLPLAMEAGYEARVEESSAHSKENWMS
jgi:hypothetical protein